jgi:hypothetical protein
VYEVDGYDVPSYMYASRGVEEAGRKKGRRK